MKSGPLVPRADTVEVWHASLETPPVSVTELEAVLTVEERARGDRFKHPRIRDQFVRSRGLLRVLLGRYLDLPAAAVPIGINPDGKPILSSGTLEFNVSHAGGLALFAVASRAVGVDIEAVRLVPNMDALVERFFSSCEVEQYRSLLADLRCAGFFRGWTCKEAVLKGIGCGTRELDRCIVDLDPRTPPRIVGPQATVASWSVASWVPGDGYIAAVAVQGNEPLQIREGSATAIK